MAITMTGTIVNAVAIVLGGIIGLFIKNGIPEKIKTSIIAVQGLSVLVISGNGIITSMFSVDMTTGKLQETGGLLLLISLVVGTAIGEIIDIDRLANRGGDIIESKLGAEGFSKGLVSATLIFAIGAMAIIGSLNDGLTGDSSVLFVKSTLDFVMSIILASSLGIGVAFSAIPVFLYQGAISLCAGWLSPILQGETLSSVTMVGYAMVATIGLNFLFNLKIKTANILPALLIPIGYHLVVDTGIFSFI